MTEMLLPDATPSLPGKSPAFSPFFLLVATTTARPPAPVPPVPSPPRPPTPPSFPPPPPPPRLHEHVHSAAEGADLLREALALGLQLPRSSDPRGPMRKRGFETSWTVARKMVTPQDGPDMCRPSFPHQTDFPKGITSTKWERELIKNIRRSVNVAKLIAPKLTALVVSKRQPVDSINVQPNCSKANGCLKFSLPSTQIRITCSSGLLPFNPQGRSLVREHRENQT